MVILEFLKGFLASSGLIPILVLIFVDVLFGIWASILKGIFEWAKVGQFYRTNVIPYVGGYLTLYVAFTYLLPGGLAQFLPLAVMTGAYAFIVASLVGSIAANVKEMGLRM